MKTYVVLYYAPPEAMQTMSTATPEEMAEGQKKWMDWFEEIGDSLVEQGSFFGAGKSFTSDGVEDSSGEVTGYSLIQAESLAATEEMLKDHPHISWQPGCRISVYEPMDYKQ